MKNAWIEWKWLFCIFNLKQKNDIPFFSESSIFLLFVIWTCHEDAQHTKCNCAFQLCVIHPKIETPNFLWITINICLSVYIDRKYTCAKRWKQQQPWVAADFISFLSIILLLLFVHTFFTTCSLSLVIFGCKCDRARSHLCSSTYTCCVYLRILLLFLASHELFYSNERKNKFYFERRWYFISHQKKKKKKK